MTTRSHPTTAVHLDIPGDKCSCSRSNVQRVCTGCYVFFCIECYEDHRQKESKKFGYIIDDDDIIADVCRPLQPSSKNVRRFDPLSLRDSIWNVRDQLRTAEDRAVLNAMKALRTLLDERHDKLMKQIEPIRVDRKSMKGVESYINSYLEHSKEVLRRKNDELEETDRAKFACVTENLRAVDWSKLIDIETIARHVNVTCASGIGLPPPIPITLEYEDLSRRLLRRIPYEHPLDSGALAASDHLVMYVQNNELVIAEAGADYSVIIPMCEIKGTVPDIIDICWSSLYGVFIVLTEEDVFELSPHLKKLKHLKQIHPADDRSFGSCTCFNQTLLVSYKGGCWVDEWQGTGDEEWKKTKKWDFTPSDEASLQYKIRCIRFSCMGSTVGCVLSNDRHSDRFEIHDSKTMNCKSSVIIPAKICCGCIWLPDGHWLVAVQNWNIIFLVSRDGRLVDPLTYSPKGKSTIQNIALVDFATVVIRTLRTVVFLDLLGS